MINIFEQIPLEKFFLAGNLTLSFAGSFVSFGDVLADGEFAVALLINLLGDAFLKDKISTDFLHGFVMDLFP